MYWLDVQVVTKHIKDKKLRGKLRQSEKLVKEAALTAAKVSEERSRSCTDREMLFVHP
jgi:hypothetical protein